MNKGANASIRAPAPAPMAAQMTTTASSSIPAPAAPGVGLRGRLIGCAGMVKVLGHDARAPARYSVWRVGVGTGVGGTPAPPADGVPRTPRGAPDNSGPGNFVTTL